MKTASIGRISAANDDWQAQMDLDTVLEADRIRKDPKRMAAVRKCAKHRREQMAKDMVAVAAMEEPAQG